MKTSSSMFNVTPCLISNSPLKFVPYDITTLAKMADPEYYELVMAVRSFMPPDVCLGGGTWRRLIEGQPYTGADFDFYFPNQKSLDKFDLRGYTKKFTTSNADSYLTNMNGRQIIIQCIRKFFTNNDLPGLITRYDLRCCMLIAQNGNNFLIAEKHAMDDIAKRELRLNFGRIRDGYNTAKRLMKFSQDGYNIDNKQLYAFIDGIQNHSISTHGAYPSDEFSNVNDFIDRII